MRLLWLKYGELLPVDTGGKLRSYNLLKQLHDLVDLTFVSYTDAVHDPAYPALIEAALPGSRFIVAGDLPGWREISAGPVVRSILHGAPFGVTRFASGEVRRRLTAWLAAGEFDMLLCDFLTPTLCLPADLPVPLVLFEHNVESAVWARRAATIPRGPRRLLHELEARATLRWERRMLHRADLTLAVSAADRLALETIAPGARVAELETGVDVAAFSAPAGGPRDPDLVIFVGSMDWQPNEDGVLWFADQAWPQVLAMRPGTKFRVVGRRPPASIEALRQRGIEVTGDVESVLPHLAEAALTVVPLRAGGGTRIKIFEAMAAGVPVVSTTLGAEGLPVTPGQDIAIADGADDLAAEVVRQLRSPLERDAMAARGRSLAEAHDWSRIAGHLAELLATVAR